MLCVVLCAVFSGTMDLVLKVRHMIPACPWSLIDTAGNPHKRRGADFLAPSVPTFTSSRHPSSKIKQAVHVPLVHEKRVLWLATTVAVQGVLLLLLWCHIVRNKKHDPCLSLP